MFEHSGKAAAATFAAWPAVPAERPVRKTPFAAAILGFFAEMTVIMVNGSHVVVSPFLNRHSLDISN
jgi:hypothetical protein